VLSRLNLLNRPWRLSWLVWVVALALTAAGVLWLTVTSDTVEVYIAIRDLPVYHQVTSADVELARIGASDMPDDAVRDGKVLPGAYTLRAVEKGSTYRRGQLGPRLPDGTLDGPLVAVRAAPETTMGDRLARGDRVDVLLPPGSGAARGKRLSGLLVVDLVDGRNAAVILRAPTGDDLDLLALRRSDGPVIVRTGPYAAP
jgi:hypothetical protein